MSIHKYIEEWWCIQVNQLEIVIMLLLLCENHFK